MLQKQGFFSTLFLYRTQVKNTKDKNTSTISLIRTTENRKHSGEQTHTKYRATDHGDTHHQCKRPLNPMPIF